jgi:methionine--tRNA ligase beta chain
VVGFKKPAACIDMKSIGYDQFESLDIRVGTVVEATAPHWSHWVIKLTVDLGHEIGARVIFAGLLGFYEPEDLVGKQYPFLVNIEPKKIGPEGDLSHGMMLAADMKLTKPVKLAGEEKSDHKPVLFELTETVPNGSKVM